MSISPRRLLFGLFVLALVLIKTGFSRCHETGSAQVFSPVDALQIRSIGFKPAGSGFAAELTRRVAPAAKALGWGVAGGTVISIAGSLVLDWTFVRSELSSLPVELHAKSRAVRWAVALYRKYIDPFVEVRGLTGQQGVYVLNHPYHSGLDGLIFVELLTMRTGRAPKVLITGETRNWLVSLERWLLVLNGIGVIVPPTQFAPPNETEEEKEERKAKAAHILTEFMGDLLDKGESVVVFSGGHAVADPDEQLKGWSRSAVYAALRSRRPIIPVAVGGFPFDWTPFDAGREGWYAQKGRARGDHRFYVHVGEPITPDPGRTPRETRDQAADAVRALMQKIPALWAHQPKAPNDLRLTIKRGRSLAYVRHKADDVEGPIVPIILMHSFQSSRWERVPGMAEIAKRQRIEVFTPDRVGATTANRGRTYKHWLEDLEALHAKEIGSEKAILFGMSGGAPFALAAGAMPWVSAIGLAAAMPPPEWIDGLKALNPTDRYLLQLARSNPRRFVQLVYERATLVLNDWPVYAAQTLLDLGAEDQQLLQRPDIAAIWRESRQEGYAQGAKGILDDVQALFSPLGLRPRDLRKKPILLWHGEKDRLIPPGSAIELHRKLIGSVLFLLPDRGHYFAYDPVEFERMMRSLRATHMAA